jgi:hypothetical protein
MQEHSGAPSRLRVVVDNTGNAAPSERPPAPPSQPQPCGDRLVFGLHRGRVTVFRDRAPQPPDAA